ncbi:MAG: AMP-binding protein, partial [Bacteroidales bacterium]
MNNYTICSLITDSVEKHAGIIALSYVNEDKGISYQALGIKVSNLAGKLATMDIGKGDKVAIIGESSPNWGISFLSITCLGAVAVPVLPDFHVDEIMNIIQHSETKMVFVSAKQFKKLEKSFQDTNIPVFILDDLSPSGKEYEKNIYRSICFSCLESSVKEDDLATIIYTSGTTGTSKGVMLTHKNISWMVNQSLTMQDVNEHDRFLSILPMAHTYENSLGFLLPLHCGATIYYLKKQPTPTVLLDALSKVKPTTLLTVPLIIEKIYRKQVLPKFKKNGLTRTLFSFTPTRKLLNYLAGKKL